MLDLSKIEKLHSGPNNTKIGRCPICALQGQDKSGNHLSILPDGRYNCIRDSAHNKQIFQLLSNGEINENIPVYVEEKLVIPKSWPVSVLDGLVKDYSYWNKRGISDETCEYFNIGLAFKGVLNNRSVVPIFSLDKSKIIGFTGRALNNEMKPKWKHINSKDHFIMQKCDSNLSLILVESPGDVLTLFENNIKNVICLFGTNLSSHVLSYIVSLNPSKILIATNNEPGNNNIGNKAAEKIRDKLGLIFDSDKIVVALPTKKDFNEMSVEEINEWINKYGIGN